VSYVAILFPALEAPLGCLRFLQGPCPVGDLPVRKSKLCVPLDPVMYVPIVKEKGGRELQRNRYVYTALKCCESHRKEGKVVPSDVFQYGLGPNDQANSMICRLVPRSLRLERPLPSLRTDESLAFACK